jgi:hypothetical protein
MNQKELEKREAAMQTESTRLSRCKLPRPQGAWL